MLRHMTLKRTIISVYLLIIKITIIVKFKKSKELPPVDAKYLRENDLV